MRLLISITIIGITLFTIPVVASSLSSTTSVDPKSMHLSRRKLHSLSKRGRHKGKHHGKKKKHDEEEEKKKKEEKKENNSDGGKPDSNSQSLIPGNIFQQPQSFIPTMPTLPTLSPIPALPPLPALPNISNLFGSGGS